MHEPVMLRSLNWQDNSAVQHATEPPLGNALPIPIEIFQTSGKWRRPAVLFLHGSTGLTPKYYPLIYYLAQQGYVIFVPRYLAQPGRSLAGESAIRANFAAWLRTLMNVLAQMTSWPGIDPNRAGVIGMSLGASLGLVLASRCPAIHAFVHWTGVVPEEVMTYPAYMPPTLVIHGGSDSHVPVQAVIRLAANLRALNVPCELKIYPCERHILRPIVGLQAAEATGAFLDKYL